MTPETGPTHKGQPESASPTPPELSKIGRWLVFLLLRTTWYTEGRVRLAFQPLQDRSLVLLSLLPGAGIVAGIWLYHSLRSDIGVDIPLHAAVLGEMLVSVGTALTGVSAIAFSLSMFLQQSASDLYSPLYFLGYSYDRKQKAAFGTVVGVVMAQLSYGLYLRALGDAPIPLLGPVLVGTFSSTGLVFSLLLWQFLHVARKTTPIEAIAFLQSSAISHYRRIHKRACRTARLLTLQSGGTLEQALAGVYASVLPTSTATLMQPINALSEITMRMSNRGDQVATRQGLSAISTVLGTYFLHRRSSSSAISSSTHPFAIEGDSQSFLNLAFEKLNEIGDGFLRAGQLDNARTLVDTYGALSVAAAQIRFINRANENPIEYQLAYHLRSYVSAAIKAGDIEVPFRAIDVYAGIGEHAAVRGDATLVYLTADAISEIGARNASAQELFIAEGCCVAHLRLLRALINWPGDARTCFDEVLKQLFSLHLCTIALSVAGGAALPTAMALRKPFDVLSEFVIWVREKHHDEDETENGETSAAFESFTDTLYGHLRTACEGADLQSPYVDAMVGLIYETVVSLTALEREEGSRTVTDAVDRFIHLPSWLGRRGMPIKSPRGLEYGIDAVCKVALMLMERGGRRERVAASMDAQFGIVKRALKWNTEGTGYYEPRLMLRICYCGVVAAKYGDEQVVAGAVDYIRAFEGEWKSKTEDMEGVPTLVGEFIAWRHGVEECRRPIGVETAGEIATSLVELSDVDAFLHLAWSCEISGSRWAGYKVRRVGTRAEEAARLLAVLSRRVEVLRNDADARRM